MTSTFFKSIFTTLILWYSLWDFSLQAMLDSSLISQNNSSQEQFLDQNEHQPEPIPFSLTENRSIDGLLELYPLPASQGELPSSLLPATGSTLDELMQGYQLQEARSQEELDALNERIDALQSAYGPEYLHALQLRLNEQDRLRALANAEVAAPLVQADMLTIAHRAEDLLRGYVATIDWLDNGRRYREIWEGQRLAQYLAENRLAEGTATLGIYNKDIEFGQALLLDYTVEWLVFRGVMERLRPLFLKALMTEADFIFELLKEKRDLCLPIGKRLVKKIEKNDKTEEQKQKEADLGALENDQNNQAPEEQEIEKFTESLSNYKKRYAQLQKECIAPTLKQLYPSFNKQGRLIGVAATAVTLMQRSYIASLYPDNHRVEAGFGGLGNLAKKVVHFIQRVEAVSAEQRNHHHSLHQSPEQSSGVTGELGEDSGSNFTLDADFVMENNAPQGDPVTVSVGIQLVTLLKIFALFGGILPVPCGYVEHVDQLMDKNIFAHFFGQENYAKRPVIKFVKDLYFFLSYYNGLSEAILSRALVKLFVVRNSAFFSLLSARSQATTEQERLEIEKEIGLLVSSVLGQEGSFSLWMRERAQKNLVFNARVNLIAMTPFFFRVAQTAYTFFKPMVVGY